MPTRTRPNQNPYWNYQNQETTARIVYNTPPTTRSTQKPQTDEVRNTDSDQSYVCGIRRTPQIGNSLIIRGGTGKYFIESKIYVSDVQTECHQILLKMS